MQYIQLPQVKAEIRIVYHCVSYTYPTLLHYNRGYMIWQSCGEEGAQINFGFSQTTDVEEGRSVGDVPYAGLGGIFYGVRCDTIYTGSPIGWRVA